MNPESRMPYRGRNTSSNRVKPRHSFLTLLIFLDLCQDKPDLPPNRPFEDSIITYEDPPKPKKMSGPLSVGHSSRTIDGQGSSRPHNKYCPPDTSTLRQTPPRTNFVFYEVSTSSDRSATAPPLPRPRRAAA